MGPRIPKLSSSQERFVVERLRREWLEGEAASKRHDIVKRAAAAGIMTGKTLLLLLLAAGFLTVIAVAPNAFAAFGRAGAFRRYLKTDRDFKKDLNYGSKRSYWRYLKIKNGEYKIKLTSRGKKLALRAALKNMHLGRQIKWDGKWRVTIFDIPRKRNSERAFLRSKLKEMGMLRIQDSVFIYPYPCEKEVMFWASLLNVVHNVQVMEAKFLTGLDTSLRKEFRL